MFQIRLGSRIGVAIEEYLESSFVWYRVVADETVNVLREKISLERINVVVVAVLEGGGGKGRG